MPQFDSIPAGNPAWVELGTTDQNAAKHFYTSLLGWNVTDSPIGETEMYSMFDIGGRNVAAAYTLNAQMLAQGVPPHWMTYFATDSADATADKVESLGGKVMAPPFDVFDFGRMAAFQDPTGAFFSVWQPGTHKGMGLAYEPNTLCWSELATRDPEGAEKFYKELFGWQTNSHPAAPGGYLELKNGKSSFGGILKMTEEFGNAPPHWAVYWQVSDCDASAAKLKELGGTLHHGPFDMPSVGRIAVCADPQGANFYLIQLSA